MKGNQLIAGGLLLLVLGLGGYILSNKPTATEVAINNAQDVQVQLEVAEKVLEGEESDTFHNKNDRNSLARRNKAGDVDFEIVFINPIKNNDDYWIFQMFLNTHSVDLDAIPFDQLVSFEDDNGTVYDKDILYSKKGSGHHIEQYIKLPKHINEKDTILKEYKSMKLIIKDVQNVPETIFEWDMTVYPEIFDH